MKWIALLASAFILIPILEFAILIEVGRRIGTLSTLLLVFGTGLLGAVLAKIEGFRILTRIQDGLKAGIMPTEDVIDGLLVLVAGVLLITPGLLSDIAGLMMLFPPTRFPFKLLLKRVVRGWVSRRTYRIDLT